MTIIKTLVPSANRIGFLPQHFGLHAAMLVEPNIYAQLGSLCKAYDGGLWHFYELDNGGCFMAPNSDKPFHLENPDNDSSETMSAEAAGIVACLYTFSLLSFRPGMEPLGDKYHQLREFALEHPECANIFALID
ncbi:antirestriction protein [Cupriavidus sp. 30B13]|uniref:antirestriction protein n=1 Tax=Cupriavidus sp. 30B13 TaxID=3384241 RepID=UPI003B8F3305